MITSQTHSSDESVTATVLIVGRTRRVLGDTVNGPAPPGVALLMATTLAEVKATMGERRVDHVIIGAGLDLQTRLGIVEYILDNFSSTTVHLKDRDSGPLGMSHFATSIAAALG